jgi:hypothetical protein
MSSSIVCEGCRKAKRRKAAAACWRWRGCGSLLILLAERRLLGCCHGPHPASDPVHPIFANYIGSKRRTPPNAARYHRPATRFVCRAESVSCIIVSINATAWDSITLSRRILQDASYARSSASHVAGRFATQLTYRMAQDKPLILVQSLPIAASLL